MKTDHKQHFTPRHSLSPLRKSGHASRGIRFLVALFLLGWLISRALIYPDIPSSLASLLITTGYLIFAATFLFRQGIKGMPAYPGNVIGALVDIAIVSSLISINGEHVVLLVMLYPVLIVNHCHQNASRHFPPILIGSLVGMSLALSLNTYWSHHPIQAIGLVAGVAMLSSYFAFLVIRLQKIGSAQQPISASLAEQDKPGSETDDSRPKVISDLKPEGQKSQQRRILVLSSKPDHAGEIGRLLQDWHHEFMLCQNTAQAFHALLNGINNTDSQPFDILLVDQRALKVDPLQIAAIKHQEPSLQNISLIYLGPSQLEEINQDLQHAGYCHLLETPLNKSLLFAAIRASKHIDKQEQHVVSLVSRLSQQDDRSPPRDILLAQHNPLDRRMFERLLKHAGHKVYCVEDGDQALDALEGHHFDLAIIDLEMPIINGLQIAKLHHFTHTAQHWIPFIAVTRHKTPQTVRECEGARIDTCLVRPVQSVELLKAVNAATSQEVRVSVSRDSLPSVSQHTKTEASSHYLHLLDISVLNSLEKLDKNQDFLNSLISTFIQEGEAYLQKMHKALHHKHYQAFTDKAYLLVDSAGQLGAFSLYEYSLIASRLRPDELNKKGTEILNQLDVLFVQTRQAFLEYMASHDHANSDLI